MRANWAGRIAVAAALVVAGSFLAKAEDDGAGKGSEHDVRVEIGVGYDDNVFLAPPDPYFDQRLGSTVAPESLSGWFVPVEVRGSSGFVRPSTRFGISYTARGKFYPDSDLSNGDESYVRLRPGVEWVLGREGRRENTLWLGPVLTYNKEVYYDRDTGEDADLGGTNLADRYSYTAVGVEAEYRYNTSRRFEWDADARYEARSYESIAGVSSLDHVRTELELGVEIEMTPRSAVLFDAGYTIRDYDDRPSRGLDGTVVGSNDDLRYTYVDLGATLRLRPNSNWWLYLDVDRRDRTDEFVGYNDYAQDSVRVRAVYSSERFRLRAAVRAWQRDYDRAFIFDLPTDPDTLAANPNKSYDTLDIDLRADVPIRNGWSAFGEVDYRDQDTADPRYTYARNQISAGIAWSR